MWLDFARGLSALAVCVGHLRATVWVEFSQVTSPSLFDRAMYAATGVGHQAVMVFFVLSGFFVGGSVWNAGKGFRWGPYAVARVSRLWVVLLPCLALTAIVDAIVMAVAPPVLNGALHEVWHSGPDSSNYDASVYVLLGNLAFVQTIAVPVFGSNGPLWSLANEFWYYALFPLMITAVRGTGARADYMVRGWCALLAIGMLALMPWAMRLGYVVWLMGVALFVLTANANSRAGTALKWAAPAFGAAFVVSIAYAKSSAWQAQLGIPADLLVGTSFALTCAALVGGTKGFASLPRRLAGRTARGLSEMSYSLYLSHFPLVVLIGALGYGADRLQPDAKGVLHLLGWLGVLLSMGATIWRLFKTHTHAVRKAAGARLGFEQSRLGNAP